MHYTLWDLDDFFMAIGGFFSEFAGNCKFMPTSAMWGGNHVCTFASTQNTPLGCNVWTTPKSCGLLVSPCGKPTGFRCLRISMVPCTKLSAPSVPRGLRVRAIGILRAWGGGCNQVEGTWLEHFFQRPLQNVHHELFIAPGVNIHAIHLIALFP